MSSAHTLIAPTDNAVTADFNASECDKLFICTTLNALSNGETITVHVINSTGGQTPLMWPGTTTPVQLTGATGAAVSGTWIEGGANLRFIKSATSSTGGIGLDVLIKPRIGNY